MNKQKSKKVLGVSLASLMLVSTLAVAPISFSSEGIN